MEGETIFVNILYDSQLPNIHRILSLEENRTGLKTGGTELRRVLMHIHTPFITLRGVFGWPLPVGMRVCACACACARVCVCVNAYVRQCVCFCKVSAC
jgi:hypothetical protein